MALGNVNKLIREVGSEEMLVCRIDRHSYDRRQSDVQMEGRTFVWTRVCGKCGMRRIQRLTPKGRIISNSYTPPKDYSPEGAGPFDAEDLGELRLHIITNGLA